MIALRTILLPVDFSALSERAADWARLLAERHEATVHAVHVVPPPALPEATLPLGIPEPPPAVPALDVLVTDARDSLGHLVAIHLADCRVEQHVLVGVPHAEICALAGRIGSDLIVIGTHAPGIVRRIFLGSASKLVLEHAPCPVLMVPVTTAGRA